MPVKRWWRSERISYTRDKSLTRQKRSPMQSFNLSALAVRERAITLFFIFAAACAGTRWQAQRRSAGKLKPERKFNMKNNRSSSLENREQGYTTMDRGLGGLTAMAVGVCLFTSAVAFAAGPSNGADNFYNSDKVTMQRVTFKNQYNMKVVGNLFAPKGLDKNTKKPAIIVGHPMGAVKEQSANLYAQKLA